MAVLALAAGAAANRMLAASAESQLAASASGAAGVAADRAAATLSLASQSLQARAAAAASLPSLQHVVALHSAPDLRDQLANELTFKPYREQFKVLGVLTGGPDQVVLGAPPEPFERAGLAARAHAGGAASAVLLANGSAWLAAAAEVLAPGNSGPTPVLVLAQPLDSAALKSIDWPRESRPGVLLATRQAVLAEAGSSDGLAVLERLQAQAGSAAQAHEPGWSWTAASREVAPGLVLWTAVDTAPLAREARAPLGTTRTIVWVAAGLCALAGLGLGLRKPRPSPAAVVTAEMPLDRTQISVLRPSGGSPGHAPVDPAPSGQQYGRYQLVQQLGSGGMGDVYLAVAHGAEGFRRNFVVKRLRPELTRDPRLVAQFIDEARLASGLVHSNVVPVFDFGRLGDEYYMAQEYIAGRDLERLCRRCLERDGQPPPAHLLFYAAHQVLQALAYAHAKHDDAGKPMDLVHRDVSPQNVMVSTRGEVKLLDFGIVKSSARANQTEAGVVKGNVLYMAPEQARGLPVDKRADLFSVGLVLFRCLTGESLYREHTAYELLVHAANGPSEGDLGLLARLPPPAGELLARALQADPSRRFQSAEEFAAALPQPRPTDAAELAELVQRHFGPELDAERAALAGAPAAVGGAA